MKVIIAGGRDFFDYDRLERSMADLFSDGLETDYHPQLEIVSGMARGADTAGVKFATNNAVPCARFPADWETYGKSAGFHRNADMAAYADVLVAFWDGKSRGTKHMIEEALRKGLEVHVYRYTREDE